MLDDKLTIDTPENVRVDFEIAGIGTRFMATLIDVLWLTGVRVLISMVGAGLFFAADLSDETGIIIASIGLLVFFIIGWGYYIFFEISWNGQTPGKRKMGIRTVKLNGLPISASEAIIRNLMRVVDTLPAWYAAGFVVMFLNAQARRLGDLAAGTLVIYDQTEISLNEIKRKKRTHLAGITVSERVADMPIELIPADLHELAEDFLNRRPTLDKNNVQILVANQVLTQIYQKMDIMPEYARLSDSAKVSFIQQICIRLRERDEQVDAN
ncbi:MAG: RDD family protein [Anaerolineae bacterium]